MNVTSCHASAENNDPDWATQIATSKPNRLPAATPSDASKLPVAKKPVKLVRIASALRPKNRPARIKAAMAATFAEVKTFWTILPYSRPRELVHVRNPITATPTSCAVESENA